MEIKLVLLLLIVFFNRIKLNRCRKAAYSGVQTILRVADSAYGGSNDHEACGPEMRSMASSARKPVKNVEELLRDMNLTKFLTSAQETGILNMITSGGSYSILVPCNEAFEDLVTNPAQQDSVRDVLSRHIVPNSVSGLNSKSRLSTLKSGASLITQTYAIIWNPITVNCARTTMFGRKISNSYLYVVDRLLPEVNRTLYQILTSDSKFSQFMALVDEDTRRLLEDPETFYTVFAFTNDGFAKLPQEIQQRINDKAPCVADIIYNHMTPMQICTSAMMAGDTSILGLDGGTLFFRIEPQGRNRTITVNGRHLIAKDIVATNGVIHILDKPLIYDHNMDLFAALASFGAPRFSKAMQQVEPISQLVSSQNDTMFYIPNVHSVLEILNTSGTELKQKLLKNHAAQSIGSDKIKTLMGFEFELHTKQVGSLFKKTTVHTHVGCAKLGARLTTCNGLIREIDRALPLLYDNVIDILKNRSDLSTFLSLVESSGMIAQLKDASNTVTLLAPINDHLAHSLLSSDRETLKAFVRRHIFQGKFCCHQFNNEVGLFGNLKSKSLKNLDGASQTITGTEDQSLFVSGSKIKNCNLQAVNGIVHVISGPLPA